ncbi:MAG: DUF483 domain-containing protein [Candidatus Hadarchaeales archaeon]
MEVSKDLVERLLRQPPTTVVDLLMTAKGLKTGSEIIRKQRDAELERLINDLGLVFEWGEGVYAIARSKEDIVKRGTDSVSRGRWFGIPECCIQNYQGKDKEELHRQLSLEELRLIEEEKSVPDEFYLGSMGYIPCSMLCQPTLERGIKVRAILEEIDPRLWRKFRNLHIRRRFVEYGGEVKSWRGIK